MKRGCKGRNFNYPKVEQLVLLNISELDISDLLDNEQDDAKRKELNDLISRTEYRLTNLEEKMSGLLDDLEAAPAVARSSIRERIGTRAAEIEAAKFELATLKDELERLNQTSKDRGSGPALAQELASLMDKVPPEQRYTTRARLGPPA